MAFFIIWILVAFLLLSAALNIGRVLENPGDPGRLAHAAQPICLAVLCAAAAFQSGLVRPLSLMKPGIVLGLALAVSGLAVFRQKEVIDGERVSGLLAAILGLVMAVVLAVLQVWLNVGPSCTEVMCGREELLE